MSEETEARIGAGLVALTIILALLKISEVISWSWFWVCLPALLTLPWWVWLIIDFDVWNW